MGPLHQHRAKAAANVEGDIAFVVVRENKNHVQRSGHSENGCLFASRNASRLGIALPILFSIRRETQGPGGNWTPQWAICHASLDVHLGKEDHTPIAGKKQKSECCPRKTHFGPEGPVLACARRKTTMCHVCP